MKLGASFSDSIRTEKLSRQNRSFDHLHETKMRGFLFPFFIGIFSIILIGRLFIIQVVAGAYYRNLSDNNRVKTTIIHAPRGIIFDRYGKPLVYNTPGYREIVNGKTILLSSSDGINKIASGDKNLEIDSLRNYPFDEAMAHVVGYIGQISPTDLQSPQFTGYQSNDLIGQMGIEQTDESVLKGIDGHVLTEVDATGKDVRNLGQTDPIAGQNITLTIDASLQQDVFNAMSGVKQGAAIVSMPNGQILALVSKPSFDPNLFTMGKSYHTAQNATYQTIQQVLLDGVGQPLLDRAISGTYPPGSTFKLVVAAAGLETKTIDENYTINDEGILRVGAFSFSNWYYSEYGKTEGIVNVVTAIKRSNDIFFYTLGNLLGVDKLSQFAKKFGLGNVLGIDLVGEAKGLLPTKEWKEKVIKDKWYLGDDYQYGIGQGYLLTTPLQVNVWTQVIANGGTLYKPQLLKDESPQVEESNILSAKTEDLIKQGMIEGCSPGGVAYPLFNFSVKNPHLAVNGQDILAAPQATVSSDMKDEREILVACKTGTAQHGDTNTLPHAWITLFAPAYHPQIVLTVLSESSGEGSTIAGPIAKEILTKYFQRQH